MALLCLNLSVYAQLNLTLSGQLQYAASRGDCSDIWGYVDQTGKEYAIMGLNSKTSFVDISDPSNPLHIADLKTKRNRNIINFLNSINPIIEKYMADNSIYMLIDKKNVFIASKNYDITKKLIELIDNQIKTVDIK